MLSRLAIILSCLGLSLMVAAEDAAWPAMPQGAVDWRQLSRIKELPTFDVVPSAALVPVWKGIGVLLFEAPGAVALPYAAPTPGRYRVTLGYLAGGRFSPLDVSLDDQPPVTLPASADPRPLIASFEADFGWGAARLILTPAANSQCAIFGLHLEPLTWEAVDAASWRAARLHEVEATAAAPSQACAVTWLQSPEPFANRYFRLRAPAGASLLLNGELIGTTDAGGTTPPHLASWTHWRNLGLARLTVVPAAGADATFTLETSPMRGARFLPEIPPHCLPLALQPPPSFTTITMTNGIVEAILPLPSVEHGYYRGHRFEQAGIITSLTTGGHSYFAEFGQPHDPLMPDHAAGPAEEFLDPIGYHEAAPGEPFLKLGVGLFRKPSDANYFHGSAYWPLQLHDWTTDHRDNEVIFVQEVEPLPGYAYRYEKRLVLPPSKATLLLAHTFTNTGTKRITSRQYAHNFIRIDDHPIGPDYRVTFNFRAQPARDVRDRLNVTGNDYRPLGPQTFFSPIHGCMDIADPLATLLHEPSGAAVRIGGDFPPCRIWFFGNEQSICVEPFYLLDVMPGETKSWQRTYDFGQH